jgi:hypothetical protein
MCEMKDRFGFTPGKAVVRVKASDLKALWKLGRDSETHAMAHNPEFKRGHLAIGADVAKRVYGPEADINAVNWRNARLAMLMMRCGKQNVRPHEILFSIFAKFPMKWWAFGESHRGLC